MFWVRFKQNLKGIWALRAFSILLIMTLSANFWCNDKPLIVISDRGVFFPVLQYYPETHFMHGEDLEMNYLSQEFNCFITKHRGWVLWPLYCQSPYHLSESLDPVPGPPNTTHWMGTDEQGRDVFSRVIYGTRSCVLFGLCVAILSTIIGLVIGALQGYWGGKFDLYTQRLVEIWAGLPVLFMLMIIANFLTPTLGVLIIMMALFNWRSISTMVRAEFLRSRELPYVMSAKILGAKDFRIMWRHIFPNATVAAISQFPFLVNAGISSLTSLDFLGIGLKAGTPSLGELLQQAKSNLHAPWLGIYPFIALALILILVTLVGEGLRDTLDPGKSS